MNARMGLDEAGSGRTCLSWQALRAPEEGAGQSSPAAHGRAPGWVHLAKWPTLLGGLVLAERLGR